MISIFSGSAKFSTPKYCFASWPHLRRSSADLFILFLNRKVIILSCRVLTKPSALLYISVDSSPFPDMISGVLRLIDEDRVHFVDDGVVQLSLHHSFLVDHHIVAQIIETVLIVGPISDICLVSGPAGLASEMPCITQPTAEPQECIESCPSIPYHALPDNR